MPLTAVLLVSITASGSFARWERAIFLFIATSLVLYPLALASHPHWGQVGYHLVVPGIQGGASSTAVLLIIAIVGTTVAPWQLFFQQSNVIDKRITPRFIGYERADTAFGAVVVVIGAIAIMVVAVFAVRGTNLAGQVHQRPRGRPRAGARTPTGTAHCSPSCCSTPASSGPRR